MSGDMYTDMITFITDFIYIDLYLCYMRSEMYELYTTLLSEVVKIHNIKYLSKYLAGIIKQAEVPFNLFYSSTKYTL